MSEQQNEKRTADQKGGAHIARSGSDVSKTVEEQNESPVTEQPKRNKYADKMNKKKPKLSKGMRIGIGIAIIALLVGVGIFFVIKSRNMSTTDDANKTAVASRGMLETYIEGSGVTAAKKREELGRELKGKVTDVLVEVGDEVKKGDKLVVVNPTETKAELETAEAELTDAQRGVTTAQAQVTQAQNAANAVQKKLNRLTVTAPFTGKVIPHTDSEGNTTSYRVGQQLSEGEVIGYMVDDSKMKLSLYFSAAYAKDIKSGQTATISVPSAMSSISGSVSSVESSQKISQEGVKLFRVIVSVNNPGTLTKGMVATATVSTPTAGEVFPAESGTLEYSREEAITVQTGGEIKSLNGLDYYTYTSGTAIMTLTSDAAQDELKAARDNVVTAQNGVVTAQKLVQTKQDRINELKKIIADSTLKAPIDGVIVSLNAVRDMETAGTDPLVVVADLNDIIVNAEIMSTDVAAVQPGQPAMMTMYTNDGSLSLTGSVVSVALEPTQNQNGGQGSMPTFPAIIAIDPIEGQAISIGMGVEFQITTASSMDCIMVPSSAIVYTETGTAVFAKPLTDESGAEIPFSETLPIPEGTQGIPPEFQLVPVEVGISDSSNTEVLWGIDEGTTVYLSGPEDLYADMGMDGGTVVVG